MININRVNYLVKDGSPGKHKQSVKIFLEHYDRNIRSNKYRKQIIRMGNRFN